MLKRDIPIVRKSGNKCGDCIHFDKIKHTSFPTVCSKNGVERVAEAPACYFGNVFLLQRHQPDILNQIGLLVKDFTAAQSRVLADLLKKRKQFGRYKLAFGMPVYVCLGDDFLNNYFRGYVIGVTSHGDPTVYVTTDLGKKQVSKPVILSLLPDSVFNVVEFKKKREFLVKKKKLNDPKKGLMGMLIKKEKATAEYEPPTLDTVPVSWFDKFAKKSQKMGKRGELVFKIER